jgi:predicted nucleic-acid-binding protein
LNDPVASYEPFVMNTQDQIYEAIEDYRSGKMGVINPNIGISKARLH